MKVLLSGLILMLSFSTAHAQLYRWVDDQGKVHYSDQPPPAKTQSSKTLPIPNQPAPAAPSTAKTWQEKELDFKQRKTEAAEAEAKKKKEAEDAKIKTENCDKARKNLRTLEEGGRVATYDEKGNRGFMDDTQRTQAIEQAKKAVADWCK